MGEAFSKSRPLSALAFEKKKKKKTKQNYLKQIETISFRKETYDTHTHLGMTIDANQKWEKEAKVPSRFGCSAAA